MTDDDYQRFADHLAAEMRRWVPPGARITLTLRGPNVDAGKGPVTEIAITWETLTAAPAEEGGGDADA
jgi:hypothetical protein